MFVRKKKNPSGIVSVQIIDKRNGTYKVLKTIGSSSDALEVERLFERGKKWISHYCGDRDMFAIAEKDQEERKVTESLLDNVENILLNGTQLILNEVFNLVGFDAIEDDILKHLVVARLCQPAAKPEQQILPNPRFSTQGGLFNKNKNRPLIVRDRESLYIYEFYRTTIK